MAYEMCILKLTNINPPGHGLSLSVMDEFRGGENMCSFRAHCKLTMNPGHAEKMHHIWV